MKCDSALDANRFEITSGNFDDDYPAWSPNYKKVVFSTNRRGGEYELPKPRT